MTAKNITGIDIIIGNNIRKIRTSKGWSMKNVANKLNITFTIYNQNTEGVSGSGINRNSLELYKHHKSLSEKNKKLVIELVKAIGGGTHD